MAQTFPDAKRHPHKPARANRMTLVQKITRTAGNVASGSEGARRKLYDLVLQCLENGNEPALREALAQIDNPEAFDELEFTVQQAAVSAFNIILQTTGERLNVELFAIPLVFALEGDQYQEVPPALPGDLTDWLARSFRAHGLKDPGNETVMLGPELWSPQEIYHLPFHKVFELAHAYGEAIGNRTLIDPENTLGATVMPSPIDDGDVMLCLRYVIGAFVHAPGSLLPFQEEENESKLEAWTEAVEARFSQHYGAPVEVFDPDSLYDALENAWFRYHALAATLERTQMLENAQTLPAEVSAVISLHGGEDDLTQIRIGYSRVDEDGDFELIGGSVWKLAPFDDPADIAEFLKLSLEDAGLAQVEIVAELQEEAYCEDCGEPTFLAPTQPAAPGLSPFFPAPRHLH
jgi:hypothetical protein